MQAITATIIGVLGTGFISVLVYAMRTLSARLDRFEDKVTGQISSLSERMHKGFKEHGERLARIEARLEIDPPAEAA